MWSWRGRKLGPTKVLEGHWLDENTSSQRINEGNR
jgi:hypothetical protein